MITIAITIKMDGFLPEFFAKLLVMFGFQFKLLKLQEGGFLPCGSTTQYGCVNFSLRERRELPHKFAV